MNRVAIQESLHPSKGKKCRAIETKCAREEDIGKDDSHCRAEWLDDNEEHD